MSSSADFPASRSGSAGNIWFTRCPVPTASGIAYSLGWLTEEFSRDGWTVRDLRDAPDSLLQTEIAHDMETLFREGGAIPALSGRASGADSQLIGLTWVDEGQAILVRKETGPIRPDDLKDLRVALPAYNTTRATSIARGMTLRGIKGVLAAAGLGLDDVEFVETPLDRYGWESAADLQRLWASIDYLVDGRVDAVYVKGAAAVDLARRTGVVVGINIDLLPARALRVNNGTPRPITTHRKLIDEHFDLVVRFLEQSLRAADWAAENLDALRDVLKRETRAENEGVATAYRNDFHRSLHPILSDELLGYLKSEANFLWLHGFLEHPVDVNAWVDRRPLQEALRRRALTKGAEAKVE